ncbi:MAG: cobaltochelatase subunit CobN, partial [Dolichospermum sp.]
GLLHPDYPGFFTSPREYLQWYLVGRVSKKGGQDVHPTKPVIGILLYRKHVITKLPYIPQLIRHFEKTGLIPLPIFINGVEGHVAVRDWMTSDYETQQRQQGNLETPSLS